MNISSLQILLRGGFMMIPLLLAGLIAVVVTIERFFFFRKITAQKNLSRLTCQELQAGHLDKVKQMSGEATHPGLDVINKGLRDLDRGEEMVKLSMQNQAEAWTPILERRLEILDTIITAAPLMGLLGTITGMMSSFQVMSEKGINEPNSITGGVAEALIATATGLVIALLCLFAYNYFNQIVKNLLTEMERCAGLVLEARARQERP